jgi:hypothetical protein
MALTIDLTPDLERRLADEAARLGQPAELFARAILEERLAPSGGTNRRDGRTPEQILGDYFARCPRASPEDLAALAREQGIEPVSDFALLRGDRPGRPPAWRGPGGTGGRSSMSARLSSARVRQQYPIDDRIRGCERLEPLPTDP